MIPACDRQTVGRTVRRSDGQTESIMAKTALCIASYADALSKIIENCDILRRLLVASVDLKNNCK